MAAANKFMHHLSMAACEWFLIFLMYMDAALGLILTKFARQCELQPPCLFCFRFDHVFGEKPDAYLSHFCNKHRGEVTCLVSCDLHRKLSDVREMCDDCFTSITKQKPGYLKPLLNKNFVRAPSSTGSCSCCERQWKPKPRSQMKLGVPKVTMHPPLPLTKGRGRGRPGGRFRRRNYFSKARDKISGTVTPCFVDTNIRAGADMDALSDSGCADLKFNSCSGSESGDSFYEIECENENDSRIVIHQRSNSVPILEPSLLNGIHNESLVSPLSSTSTILEPPLLNGTRNESIASPLSSISTIGEPPLLNGIRNESIVSPLSSTSSDSTSTVHDVKENGSPEVGNETSSLNQDLHSFNGDEVSPCSDKHEGFESPGAHSAQSVGEINGDCDIEKLKRQMEHDQEQLRLLHKELDEERNAAAIAADEAMAMITRLQEEKSALHTEALQYLRMMDEQAEYDMEALDKANDLVTEKEKEIQDLEAELEYFRSRYDDEMITGDTPVNFKENHTENGKIESLSISSSCLKSTNTFEPRVNNLPVLDLEDEKKHVLQSLSESERKYHQLSNGGDKPSQQNEIDMRTLENEISDLSEWLEALESDRDFLEHASNTVQSHVGLEFIQEIAQHLHDMRRIRFDRRCQTVD
ncbi:putative myosin-binding protein [Helianthus annuus]|nr:putative myosin-binding protein [Helianthus annuus]